MSAWFGWTHINTTSFHAFQVFREYFKSLEEESIRDNFVTVYELMDEVMDFGFPQTTDSKILLEWVITKSMPSSLLFIIRTRAGHCLLHTAAHSRLSLCSVITLDKHLLHKGRTCQRSIHPFESFETPSFCSGSRWVWYHDQSPNLRR